MAYSPGTPRLLRAINDRAALELLVEHGPLTRTQISDHTGLSKVTVGQLIERLQSRGLVGGAGEVDGRRGPNARLYGVVPGAAYVAGVDVRPDSTVTAVADLTGHTVGKVVTSMRGVDDPAAAVHQAIVAAATEAGVTADALRQIVIGSPGLIDPRTGEIEYAWDLPQWRHGLLPRLRGELGTNVRLENDANLVAIAEHASGVAQGVSTFALLWFGRGIGLSLVLQDQLYRGASGGAGEIGYLPVVDPRTGAAAPTTARHRAERRPTGHSPQGYARGFQALVGAQGVIDLAASHGFRHRKPGRALRAALAAGEKGQAFLEELAARVSLGVVAVATVVDPTLVVLAGEVSQTGGAAFSTLVADQVAETMPLRPRIEASGLGPHPVLTGALQSALEQTRDELFGGTT